MSKTTDEGQDDTEDEFDKNDKYGNAAVGVANRTGSVKVGHSDEAFLQGIYDRYLAGGAKAQSERGVTLMLRDIPYRLQVEPDLLDLLRQTCEMEHVDYIYLPMNIDMPVRNSDIRMRNSDNKMRNKGYCFIHFSVAAPAQAFASRIYDHAAFGGKHITICRAKFQGLGTNLMNLLDI